MSIFAQLSGCKYNAIIWLRKFILGKNKVGWNKTLTKGYQ